MAVLLVGLAAMSASPALEHLRSAGRGRAGARELASTFRLLRAEAVARRQFRGLWFDHGPRGWRWRVVADGNGNGLRTAEVRDGTDPTLEGPYHLQDRVEHVRPGFPGPGPFTAPPPGSGPRSRRSDQVRPLGPRVVLAARAVFFRDRVRRRRPGRPVGGRAVRPDGPGPDLALGRTRRRLEADVKAAVEGARRRRAFRVATSGRPA